MADIVAAWEPRTRQILEPERKIQGRDALALEPSIDPARRSEWARLITSADSGIDLRERGAADLVHAVEIAHGDSQSLAVAGEVGWLPERFEPAPALGINGYPSSA
jgi:hypothetical protein